MLMAAAPAVGNETGKRRATEVRLLLISILFTYTLINQSAKPVADNMNDNIPHLPLPLPEAETPNMSIHAQFWGFGPF